MPGRELYFSLEEELRRGVMIHSYWVDLMLQKALPSEEEMCLFFFLFALLKSEQFLKYTKHSDNIC